MSIPANNLLSVNAREALEAEYRELSNEKMRAQFKSIYDDTSPQGGKEQAKAYAEKALKRKNEIEDVLFQTTKAEQAQMDKVRQGATKASTAKDCDGNEYGAIGNKRCGTTS